MHLLRPALTAPLGEARGGVPGPERSATPGGESKPSLRRGSRLKLGVIGAQVMEAERVVFDGPRRRVLADGYLVHLPAREAAVLGLLMDHPGQVVCRPALVTEGWGTQRVHPATVDRLMRRLRRRLEPSPVSPARLRRNGDTGYIFGC